MTHRDANLYIVPNIQMDTHAIQRALSNIIILSKYPRMRITIEIEVIVQGEKLVADAINLCVALLLRSGIELKGVVSAVMLRNDKS